MDQVNTSSRLPAKVIETFIAESFRKVGLPDADAAKVAELMIEADLTGADAHGVFRLPMFAKRVQKGGCNTKPDIRVNKTAAATALIDGDNGMGHLVMAKAAEVAVELAREAGVAWVGTHHSNHAGAAGVYPAMMLPHDMVGIYGVVASANHMPVWGGLELLLGTNPVAVAIPAGEEAPVVLDIATSVVSYGTIKSHRLQNKPLPEGWMVNAKDGTPLTDASRSAEGLLLPIGGYKGSGLSLILGLLAGPLNGAAFGRDVFDFNYNDTDVCNTGQFLIALNISRFTPVATFKQEMDRHLRDLRTSKPLPGQTIRLPGQERRTRRADRVKNGVPIPRELMVQLDQFAAELGVKPLGAR